MIHTRETFRKYFRRISRKEKLWTIENQVVYQDFLNFFCWISYLTGCRNVLDTKADHAWDVVAVLF